MKIQQSSRTETRSRSRRGFTLVELLLVLVILATLAAIVFPKITGKGEQARIAAVQTQLGSFKTALDTFEVDNGYFPKGRNGLMDLVQKPRDAVNWHGPYMDSIPKDPWQHDYQYECPGRHNPNGFDIWSQGSPNDQTPIGNWQTQQK
jgi:general secretion pathway protein G